MRVTLAGHLKRAFSWRTRSVRVSDAEREQLATAGVLEPHVQGLAAWRRSVLLLSVPVLIIATALSVVAVLDNDTSQLTSFGKLLQWVPTISLGLIPAAALYCVITWTNLRATSRVLLFTWVASIALPLLAALVPIDGWIDIDKLRAVVVIDSAVKGTDPTVALETLELELLLLRVFVAVNYFVQLLPVLISIPGGVLKGALRAKALMPGSRFPGWFLVAVAPFYTLIVAIAFVIVNQLIGNGVLVLGIGLIAVVPLLFLFHRKTYTRPLSPAEADEELGRANRIGWIVTYAGVACIVLYALTARFLGRRIVGPDGVLTVTMLVRSGVEFFGRHLVATAVFTIMFVFMTVADWRLEQSDTDRAAHDNDMRSLSDAISVSPRPPRGT
ncbi:MAG: hypothetical protein ABL953_08155 [Ilumatobacteraceae bacterium]